MYHSASRYAAAAGYEKLGGLELFLSNLGRGLGWKNTQADTTIQRLTAINILPTGKHLKNLKIKKG